NDQGGSASVSFGWDVADAFQAPVLVNPGDQSSARGSDASLQMDASQPDGDPVWFDAVGLPSGLSIDQNGLISGNIDPSAGSDVPYQVTVTATAGDKSASVSFAW